MTSSSIRQADDLCSVPSVAGGNGNSITPSTRRPGRRGVGCFHRKEVNEQAGVDRRRSSTFTSPSPGRPPSAVWTSPRRLPGCSFPRRQTIFDGPFYAGYGPVPGQRSRWRCRGDGLGYTSDFEGVASTTTASSARRPPPVTPAANTLSLRLSLTLTVRLQRRKYRNCQSTVG